MFGQFIQNALGALSSRYRGELENASGMTLEQRFRTGMRKVSAGCRKPQREFAEKTRSCTRKSSAWLAATLAVVTPSRAHGEPGKKTKPN